MRRPMQQQQAEIERQKAELERLRKSQEGGTY